MLSAITLAIFSIIDFRDQSGKVWAPQRKNIFRSVGWTFAADIRTVDVSGT